MNIAVTGHRPDKLGDDYEGTSKLMVCIEEKLCNLLLEHKADLAITGMALGIDQMFARVAGAINIPYVAAVPFRGQESIWSKPQQTIYHDLLAKAKRVDIVSAGGYAPQKMQTRNMYMVDMCDLLIAVWDGTAGGTANCVKYAKSKGTKIIRINPDHIRQHLLRSK